MKQAFRKLKTKAGETLVESLAAILIFTMASIVMYSMVTSAGDINSTAKKRDAEIQDQLVAVERGDPDSHSGDGVVKMMLVKSDGTTVKIAEVDVDIYGGENGELFAFFVEPVGGGGS